MELKEHQRAALLTGLILSAVTTAPYAAAALAPPRGSGFVGAFFYRDDFYQYLSFVEQAARGHLLFRNKFDARPHSPALINLEWATAGLLARAAGGDMVLGFHAVRLLAIGGLVWGVARFLRDAGLQGGLLGWGLALVTTASGLGWLRLYQGTPGSIVPDVNMGLYPFHQALFNGHFVAGTALLLWTLVLHRAWRSGGGARWTWLLSATALGLVRPFDLATFCVVAATLAALEAARPADARTAWDQLGSLTGLLPVLAYLAWVLGRHPSFRLWSGPQNVVPIAPFKEFAFALGLPAAFIALGLWARRHQAEPATGRLVVAWAFALTLLLTLRAGFAAQVATSLGVLATLAAAWLTPKRLFPLATIALLPTSLFLLKHAWTPGRSAFAPLDYFAATRFLASACRDGDVLLAPTDLSLMAAGLSPCSVVQGHRVLTPDFATRVAEADRFYDPATPDNWLRDYLRRTAPRFVAAEGFASPALTGAGCTVAEDLRRFAVWTCAP